MPYGERSTPALYLTRMRESVIRFENPSERRDCAFSRAAEITEYPRKIT